MIRAVRSWLYSPLSALVDLGAGPSTIRAAASVIVWVDTPLRRLLLRGSK
jgi:hypothetical protein